MFAIGDDKHPGVSKVAEECGELLQVIGKLLATHGDPQHWDGTDLQVRLVEEMADVYAAISFVRNVSLSPEEERALELRAAEKLATFYRWHREQRGILPERPEDCERSHLVAAAMAGCGCETEPHTCESETELALREARAEIGRLLERQGVHLKMIAGLSHSVPLPSEAVDWLAQRAALIAEVGTLRADVAERDAEIERLRSAP